MAAPGQRWTEVTPSQFTHEADGLRVIRALLPQGPPFRAWSNFEFRDGHGKWHEIDLLVLGRRRLHLVELKYYAGTLRGDDLTWRRDGHRAEDSPLKLARRKAQRLATKLQDELLRWAQERGTVIHDVRTVVPFVQESVFLHHPGLRCLLPPASRLDLFGRDGAERVSGLPGISERLLEPATPQQSVGGNGDEIIAQLMARIGAVQRRQREAGSWVIDEEPIGEGDGWQDWPAFHRVVTTDRARIRFLVTPPGAAAERRTRVRRVAEHEYRIMSRLAHDGLLRPRDLLDGDLGVGLVYPLDERFQRLDLWLADQGDRVAAADRLAVLRQVAETVAYAHGNRVVHRGLTPQAVSVRTLPDGGVRVLVGDWRSAGTVAGPAMTGFSDDGVTGLFGVTDGAGGAAARLGAIMQPGGVDADRRQGEAFQAPEGVWNRDADRVRLDVFALGALAYYLLSGRAPAPDRAGLRLRLNRDDGLDLAADLPQVPPGVRALVLQATRPTVGSRLADVQAFLALLAEAERALAGPTEDVLDPLDAAPGSVIDGRFHLQRRLGAGSTAVGLLVTDLTVGREGPDATRVLKVAVDDAAGARLAAEAEVLAGLHDPRLVRMVEGPIEVGGRRALLLESAGEQTLGQVLGDRPRLSLDWLERWGNDLLEALVALDRAGVDHRDVKPANLGVREGRSDRVKHLVLFDFSLSRAGATAVTAGTPPYLDPFLDTPGRGRYDSAAERYSAAVVLFEMATGEVPRYGDGESDPLSVREEATVEASMFDPAVAGPLVGLFRTALAREASRRHDTAADMLAAWRAAFTPVPRTLPDDADERAAQAQPSTPLAEAGLSARALSAVEQYGAATVGDLVAVDPVRLSRLAGVADATRRELKDRARLWRSAFGPRVAGRPRATGTGPYGATLPDPLAAADLLVAHAGTARAESRRAAARLLLGLDPGLDAFASQAELAAATNVTPARAAQQVGALQHGWAAEPACRDLLDALAGAARRALADEGGVATVDELAGAVLAALPPAGRRAGGEPAGGEPAGGASTARVAAGLLRLALDRAHALSRADEGAQSLSTRRRGGRIALLASDPALLDPADALGKAADDLVAQADTAGEPLVPAVRAARRVREVWAGVGADPAVIPAATAAASGAAGPSDGRLLRLAAALAQRAALSGSGDLHDRDLAPATALRLALNGLGGAQPVTAQEVRDRVRSRFPALPALPDDRARLDALLGAAGLNLVYDEAGQVYRAPTRAGDTTGLASRTVTVTAPAEPLLVSGGPVGHRLAESTTSRSFLALGVDAGRVDRAVDALVTRYRAGVLDVTRVLIEAMRTQAAGIGLPWETVRAADAAPPGSRDSLGLAALVARSLPAVEAAVRAALTEAPEGTRPVLLTEIAPLARYRHLGVLSGWADLATRRPQAIWLLVPQLPGNQGPVVDGRPLPLAAHGQYLKVDAGWLGPRPVPAGKGAS